MKQLANFNSKNTFMVLGVGRSGTSTASRILHEKFNVFMGDKFRGGHYEDLDFKDNDDRFLDKKIDLYTWRKCLVDLIRKRQNKHRLWGFKNPRNAYLLDLYFEYFINSVIIYCVRDKEHIVNSLTKNYGWGKELSEKVYSERTKAIEDLIIKNNEFKSNVLLLDFTTHLSDDYIVYKIKNFLAYKVDKYYGKNRKNNN